ncbi:MAG: sulfatase-like hydrolase/transferase [Candidatus Aminicenantales bacterium]
MAHRKVALLAAGLLIGFASARAKDLNVLLITIDTLRPDRLSCYSPKHVQTPRIDSLAAKGALFERAFAHDPMTLPSHANILLGMTSLAHGVIDNGISIAPHEIQGLAQILKGGGYATGAFVSAFPLDSRFGLNQGFDLYDDRYPSRPVPGFEAERPAEKTIAAARGWLSARKGKWFCWVHLWDPHAPYAPPEPFASRFKNDPYSGEVAYVDEALGSLLDDVEKTWGDGRTLIILTADHGESLGEHGEMTHSYFAYNSTIWVPLIITGPGANASRIKDYVSHVDILPTVCDLLGLPKPVSVQGASLRPLLEGKRRKEKPIYFEALDGYINLGGAPLRGVIDSGKKFIDSPIPELYDLETDFDETKNLAPGTDLSAFKKRLAGIMTLDSSSVGIQTARKTDRETRERLQSLGYTTAPVVQTKTSYDAKDDLKTLLPLNQKLMTAAQLGQDKKLTDGVRLVEEVIKARKDYTRAYSQLSELYFSLGQKDKWLQTLERGFNANPDNFVMVSGYGIALAEMGNLDRGIEVLVKSLALFDGDPKVWDTLGVAYWKKDDYTKALEHLNTALVLAPQDAIVNSDLGNFYVAWGMATKTPENVQKSLAYFQKAIAIDPSLASTHNGLGGALKILGDNDAAIANWEKAVQLDPNYDLPVYNLAVAYLEKGDKARAFACCRKYLSLKGKNITAEEQKDIDTIIQACKK